MQERVTDINSNVVTKQSKKITLCKEPHDVEEWLYSVIENNSSLYTLEDLLCYYIKITESSFVNNHDLLQITNKLLHVLSSFSIPDDVSILADNLRILCSKLDSEWNQIVLYFLDCLFSLFPRFFPLCIQPILSIRNLQYSSVVTERMTQSCLCDDESLNCFTHSALSLLDSIDFSSKDHSYDFMDQILTLFEIVFNRDEVDTALLLPLIKECFSKLCMSGLLPCYIIDSPLSLPSLAWLLQSFLSHCEDECSLRIVLTLFFRYRFLLYENSISLQFFYSTPFPSCASLTESIVKICCSIQSVLKPSELLMLFVITVDDDIPESYDSLLLYLYSFPELGQSYKDDYVSRSIELRSSERLHFISQHLNLFFVTPLNERLFIEFLNLYPVMKSQQSRFIQDCYSFLFSLPISPFTDRILRSIQSSPLLLQLFIPFFIQWSLHQSSIPSSFTTIFPSIIDHPSTPEILLSYSSHPHTPSLQAFQQGFIESSEYSLLSYFTSDGFEIHRCINTNDYSVVSDPFLLVSFLHYLHPSSLERFRLSEYAANTEWLQQESDVFRDDLFFQSKAFPSFILLLCEMYYCLFLMNPADKEALIFGMELELCLENREDLSPFFRVFIQASFIKQLLIDIANPIVVSFLLTHLNVDRMKGNPELIRMMGEIVYALLELETIESPALGLERLRSVKAIVKEFSPRSFPSLKRKLSVSYLINCLSLMVDSFLSYQSVLEEVVRDKEDIGLSEWIHNVTRETARKYPSSPLVSSLSKMMNGTSHNLFTPSQWKETCVQVKDYDAIVKSLEDGLPVLPQLEVFQMKALPSEYLLLLLSAIQSLLSAQYLDSHLDSLVTLLPLSLQGLYEESSQRMKTLFKEALDPYCDKLVSVREYDAMTIVASFFHPLFESVSHAPSLPQADILVASLYLCVESFLSSSFETRSTQHQWVVNGMIAYLGWCKSDSDWIIDRLSIVPLIWKWCDEATLYLKNKRKITSCLISIKNYWSSSKKEENELQEIIHFLPSKQHASKTVKRNHKRMYNRNPAVNAMLEEEEVGADNYDDLADFIDPTPDTSLNNVQFTLYCLCYYKQITLFF